MFFSRAIACAIVTCLVSTLTGCGASNGFVHNAQGTRNFKNGNYSEARRYFQMASADSPQKSDYLHNLGSAMWKQGDPAGAEQVYRHALDIDPMHQPSYHSLAKLMKEQGRVGEAQNLMTAWADTQPYIPEPQIELAWLNRETGNQAASEENLRQALRIDPSNSTALAHLGQVYQDQGRSGEAVAMYRRSLHQNWYQPDVKSRVATLDGSANPQTFITWPATQTAQTPTLVNSQPMIVQNPVPTYANYPPAQSAVAVEWPVQSQPTTNGAQPIVRRQAQPSLAGIENSDPAHADDLRLSELPMVTAH